MPSPKCKTTIEFDPAEYRRFSDFCAERNVGYAQAISDLLDHAKGRYPSRDRIEAWAKGLNGLSLDAWKERFKQKFGVDYRDI